jgi:dTDP-4-amino-4,6-dideoxygalactose transaminase
MGFKQGDFPQAEQYYREAISLPMHVNLSDEDQDTVINALKTILRTPR